LLEKIEILQKCNKTQQYRKQKYVKNDFIACLGVFGFKKDEFFINLEVLKELWNYLGYCIPNNSIPN